MMSKRLQVMLEERELREIRAIARRNRMSVAEWVRRALQAARQQEPVVDSRRKAEVIRAAAEHSFPTGDIDQILAEIERGYLDGHP